jgi:hypothetical protein
LSQEVSASGLADLDCASTSGAAGDVFLEAARQVHVLDNDDVECRAAAHGWPAQNLAPNLRPDVAIHRGEPHSDWLLCDSAAPIATAGLASCNGRVWSPAGRLLASGTAQLICRPNPFAGT